MAQKAPQRLILFGPPITAWPGLCRVARALSNRAAITSGAMRLVSRDTLAIARILRAAGFSDLEDDAVGRILRDGRPIDPSALVTGRELSAELGLLRAEISLREAEARCRRPRSAVAAALGFRTIGVVGANVAPTKGRR